MKKGKCLKCGRCCKFKNLYKSLSFTEKLLMRTTQGKKRIKQMLKNDFNCPNLEYINGKAKCRVYHQRPLFCMQYPEDDNDLIDNKCGYYFEN